MSINPAPTSESSAAQQFPPKPQTVESAVERTLASLYLTTAVPPWLRDGSVTQSYGRRAAHDAIAAARLREVQNLAAITAGHLDGVVLDDDPDTQHQLLAAALTHARVAAAATGIADEHIVAAQDLGESGVPWVHAPAHRHLGRIEQLTTELAGAHTRATALALVAARALHREHQARTEITALREQLAHTTNQPGPTVTSTEPTPAARSVVQLRAVPFLPEAPAVEGGDRPDGAQIQDAVVATAPEGPRAAWEPPDTASGGVDTAAGARGVGQEVEP